MPDFSDPMVQGAAGLFALVVLVPFLRFLASKTKTPVDDQAVSLLERLLGRFRK